jgi:hypothetical protein
MGRPQMRAEISYATVRPVVIAAIVLLAVAAGCWKPAALGDLEVGDIVLGRSLAADGAIAEDAVTNLYWTNDTFYVSVQLQGSAQNVELQARWTGPDGAVAAEASRSISPNGTMVVGLEAAPPPDGHWVVGDYRVEILLNGHSQGTRDLNAR